jgi:mRNA interferase MazF
MQSSGDIVNLNLNLGRPEGREAGDLHPAIVVTAQRILDASPTVIQVVPLTSTLRGFHTEVVIEPDAANGLGQLSAAQCQHVRAVSPARVVRTIGNVGPLALSQIRETIAVIVDLP